MTDTPNKTSIPRLRSVKFKNGGAELRVLRTPHEDNRAEVEGRIAGLIETFMAHSTEIGGYAVVVWDKDGASSADLANFSGKIPAIMIPDFIRNRLLAAKIEGWTYEGLGYEVE